MPETKKQNPDSFEDTLLLLDMIKEKKMQEMKDKKVGKREGFFSKIVSTCGWLAVGVFIDAVVVSEKPI